MLKRHLIGCALITALVFPLASAHGALITRDLAFAFPHFAAQYTYDTTTEADGVGVLDGFNHYDITAFSASYDDGNTVTSWSLGDFDPTFGGAGGVFRASVDPFGTWVIGHIDVTVPTWSFSRFENPAGYILEFRQSRGIDPSRWSSLGVQLYDPDDQVFASGGYAVIPSPGTLALSLAGLFGIALQRSRSRSTRRCQRPYRVGAMPGLLP